MVVSTSVSASPTVVLLHGLGRTRRSMRSMEKALQRAGFRTLSVGYASGRLSTTEAAAAVAQQIDCSLPPGPKMAVTHSLGGVILRQLADRFPWDRSVMLAPPNQGSRLAVAAMKARLVMFTGPVGNELAEASQGRLAWADPAGECGVIAGTRPGVSEQAHDWFGRRSGAFTADDVRDGTVSTEEAKHPAMADFTTVDAGHNFLPDKVEAQTLTLRFLLTGRFGDAASPG